jgi:hypothetical protein
MARVILEKKLEPANAAEIRFSVNRIQFAIGASILLLGLAFYILQRPPNQTWLFTMLPSSISGYGAVPRLPTWLNGSLPPFLHAFALTAITGSLINSRTWAYVGASASWILIHVVFELGQGPGRNLIELTPPWLNRIPFMGHVRSYFILGTFDEADIVAAFLECACAFAVLTLTRDQRDRDL